MTTLQKHTKALMNSKYTGVSTQFDGYIQFGEIRDNMHGLIGFTPVQIERYVKVLTNPKYSYSRQKNGYISVYGLDSDSPTGVSLIGGIPNELEFLLYAFGKKGQLSPTEDMRTGR